MRATRVLTFLATAVLVVAACTASTGASPAGGSPAAAAGVTVETSGTSNFGSVLAGPNGMTLYTHAGDTATSSTCSGACAAAWPPLETTAPPMGGFGVTGQLGTLTRADGTTQVSYRGLPLYYWQGDKKPGDATGNGIDGFSVATVSGSAPMPSASAPASAPASSSSGGYGY